MSDAAAILYGNDSPAPAPAPAAPASAPAADAATRLYGSPAPEPAGDMTPAQRALAGLPPLPEPGKPAQATQIAKPTQQPAKPAQAAQQQQPARQPGVTAEAVAQAWDQSTPDTIKALRAEKAPEALQAADRALASVVTADLFNDAARGSPDVAAALAAGYRQVLVDCGASAADAQTFIQAARELDAEGPQRTPQAQARDQRDSMAALRRAYGSEDAAKAALQVAQAWTRADPRRLQIMSKLGDKPSVVMRVARLAMAARQRGEI